MKQSIQNIADDLYDYAKKQNFSGWDPYDGLNSRLFAITPLNRTRIGRLAWIQFFKRCPVNLRPLFLVPKGRNPKGIALFASTAINLHKYFKKTEYLADAIDLFAWLKTNYSTGYSGHAWGYNFPWQARHNLFPANFPTIVATSFVGMSFIDGYEITGDTSLRDVAASAAKFILNDFQIHRKGDAIAFGYGPSDKSCVYNATALGGHLFAKLCKATNDSSYHAYARNALDFVVSRQQADGSWLYGDHATQRWIDSFHTGFNLIALKKYQEYTKENRYQDAIKAGFSYYKVAFFTNTGEPKYYSTCLYPIDIHTCAVAILLFTEFGLPEKARSIAEWTIENLWNKKGMFDFQITRYCKISIPYMRWSQGWMLYALSKFLISKEGISPPARLET